MVQELRNETKVTAPMITGYTSSGSGSVPVMSESKKVETKVQTVANKPKTIAGKILKGIGNVAVTATKVVGAISGGGGVLTAASNVIKALKPAPLPQNKIVPGDTPAVGGKKFEMPVWGWVVGGLAILATILALIFKRK